MRAASAPLARPRASLGRDAGAVAAGRYTLRAWVRNRPRREAPDNVSALLEAADGNGRRQRDLTGGRARRRVRGAARHDRAPQGASHPSAHQRQRHRSAVRARRRRRPRTRRSDLGDRRQCLPATCSRRVTAAPARRGDAREEIGELLSVAGPSGGARRCRPSSSSMTSPSSTTRRSICAHVQRFTLGSRRPGSAPRWRRR